MKQTSKSQIAGLRCQDQISWERITAGVICYIFGILSRVMSIDLRSSSGLISLAGLISKSLMSHRKIRSWMFLVFWLFVCFLFRRKKSLIRLIKCSESTKSVGHWRRIIPADCNPIKIKEFLLTKNWLYFIFIF